MDSKLVDALKACVGAANVATDAAQLSNLSRDCYWYSPVLKPQLDDKIADVIVSPTTLEQLVAVLALAVRHRVSVTPKGAGTGNYGQGVPMHGGILLSTLKLDKILEITPEFARVQAGVKLIDVELRARTIGSEMRFYPSTVLTSTAAGFIAGGAGGIGSLRWGTVWDEGNIPEVTLVTAEERPRVIRVSSYGEMLGVLHSCGLTCIIAELTYALAPARRWEQFALAFERFQDAVAFSRHLAVDQPFESRLLSVHEAAIAPFLKQLVRIGAAQHGRAAVLAEAETDRAAMTAAVTRYGGSLAWHGPHEIYHKSSAPQLSNFSYNHTTVWAMQADPRWTYVQNVFDADRAYEQHTALKARYGDDSQTHLEWLKWGGQITPAGLCL